MYCYSVMVGARVLLIKYIQRLQRYAPVLRVFKKINNSNPDQSDSDVYYKTHLNIKWKNKTIYINNKVV